MKLTENKITNLITIFPLILIPLVILIIILLITKENKTNYEKTLHKIELNLIISKNKEIKLKIDGLTDLIEYQNSILEKKLKNKVKDRVTSAHKVASKLYELHKGKRTTKEIQSLIKETLRPLLWNKGESYIWILNTKGEFQLAPKYLRHLEGTSIINFQDATKRYIIQEEIDIIKKSKEGFLFDTFIKENDVTQKHYKQLAFVKSLGFYDWYLGSAEYLDTASKISIQEILNLVQKINTNRKEYIYIVDTEGTVLLHYSNSKLLGKNVLKQKNENGKRVFEKIYKATQKSKSAFLTFNWVNPKTKNVEKKYSYVKRIPSSMWIIGSGFYESSIKNIAKKDAEILYADYNLRIEYIVIVGLLSMMISMMISLFISKYLKKIFSTYSKNMNQKSDELQKLNETLEDKIQSRTKKIDKQNKIISTQSKVAAVGEMIGNIAHQWRQPLTVISTNMASMKLSIALDKKLTNEEIEKIVEKVDNQCQYLSSTIDDFRNFFNDNSRDIKEFDIQEGLNKTIGLIKDSYANNHIKIILDLTSCTIIENENTFIQSMINIFNNAKDSMVLNNIPTSHRYMFVTMIINKGELILSVKDSGAGVDENIMTEIFEPYFTTKYKSNGTGLGLYMTHQIVTKHLKGTIYVENNEYEYDGKKLKGANFIILIPLKQQSKDN